MDAFLGALRGLMDAACRNDEEGTAALVRELVPTYHPEDGGDRGDRGETVRTGGNGT